ncbi:hypothetical protein Q3A80_18845 [Burkholderia sp. SR8]|jgi:hypothetical protein
MRRPRGVGGATFLVLGPPRPGVEGKAPLAPEVMSEHDINALERIEKRH